MEKTLNISSQPSEKLELIREIKKLKEEKNAVILAHYYQEADIQQIADFVGDSLYLSKCAAKTDAEMIVFAGVHFMAETAKILNPGKKVVLPDLEAGCSLAESCPPQAFREFREKNPDHIAVTYINCSAEVKALSDIICTSSNAKQIIESIPKDKPILFTPDKNMGKYLVKTTGREMLLWDGVCMVHEAFSITKLISLCQQYPSAKIAAHPESSPDVLKVAHFIGSTSGILAFVRNDPGQTFIIATEAGILHQMMKDVPQKTLIPAPAEEDNSCACSECYFMKLNTLEKLYHCMENESPEITIPEEIRKRALMPIERMLQFSS